jgi:hypothetical protein
MLAVLDEVSADWVLGQGVPAAPVSV